QFAEKPLRPSRISVQTRRHWTVTDTPKPVAQRAQVPVAPIEAGQDQHRSPITPAHTDTPEDGFDQQQPELRSGPPGFVREVGEAEITFFAIRIHTSMIIAFRSDDRSAA